MREAFELFDSDGDQRIAAKELHIVMQAIGQNMELSEVESSIRTIKKERGTAGGSDQEDEDD